MAGELIRKDQTAEKPIVIPRRTPVLDDTENKNLEAAMNKAGIAISDIVNHAHVVEKRIPVGLEIKKEIVELKTTILALKKEIVPNVPVLGEQYAIDLEYIEKIVNRAEKSFTEKRWVECVDLLRQARKMIGAMPEVFGVQREVILMGYPIEMGPEKLDRFLNAIAGSLHDFGTGNERRAKFILDLTRHYIKYGGIYTIKNDLVVAERDRLVDTTIARGLASRKNVRYTDYDAAVDRDALAAFRKTAEIIADQIRQENTRIFRLWRADISAILTERVDETTRKRYESFGKELDAMLVRLRTAQTAGKITSDELNEIATRYFTLSGRETADERGERIVQSAMMIGTPKALDGTAGWFAQRAIDAVAERRYGVAELALAMTLYINASGQKNASKDKYYKQVTDVIRNNTEPNSKLIAELEALTFFHRVERVKKRQPKSPQLARMMEVQKTALEYIAKGKPEDGRTLIAMGQRYLDIFTANGKTSPAITIIEGALDQAINGKETFLQFNNGVSLYNFTLDTGKLRTLASEWGAGLSHGREFVEKICGRVEQLAANGDTWEARKVMTYLLMYSDAVIRLGEIKGGKVVGHRPQFSGKGMESALDAAAAGQKTVGGKKVENAFMDGWNANQIEYVIIEARRISDLAQKRKVGSETIIEAMKVATQRGEQAKKDESLLPDALRLVSYAGEFYGLLEKNKNEGWRYQLITSSVEGYRKGGKDILDAIRMEAQAETDQDLDAAANLFEVGMARVDSTKQTVVMLLHDFTQVKLTLNTLVSQQRDQTNLKRLVAFEQDYSADLILKNDIANRSKGTINQHLSAMESAAKAGDFEGYKRARAALERRVELVSTQSEKYQLMAAVAGLENAKKDLIGLYQKHFGIDQLKTVIDLSLMSDDQLAALANTTGSTPGENLRNRFAGLELRRHQLIAKIRESGRTELKLPEALKKEFMALVTDYDSERRVAIAYHEISMQLKLNDSYRESVFHSDHAMRATVLQELDESKKHLFNALGFLFNEPFGGGPGPRVNKVEVEYKNAIELRARALQNFSAELNRGKTTAVFSQLEADPTGVLGFYIKAHEDSLGAILEGSPDAGVKKARIASIMEQSIFYINTTQLYQGKAGDGSTYGELQTGVFMLASKALRGNADESQVEAKYHELSELVKSNDQISSAIKVGGALSLNLVNFLVPGFGTYLSTGAFAGMATDQAITDYRREGTLSPMTMVHLGLAVLPLKFAVLKGFAKSRAGAALLAAESSSLTRTTELLETGESWSKAGRVINIVERPLIGYFMLAGGGAAYESYKEKDWANFILNAGMLVAPLVPHVAKGYEKASEYIALRRAGLETVEEGYTHKNLAGKIYTAAQVEVALRLTERMKENATLRGTDDVKRMEMALRLVDSQQPVPIPKEVSGVPNRPANDVEQPKVVIKLTEVPLTSAETLAASLQAPDGLFTFLREYFNPATTGSAMAKIASLREIYPDTYSGIRKVINSIAENDGARNAIMNATGPRDPNVQMQQALRNGASQIGKLLTPPEAFAMPEVLAATGTYGQQLRVVPRLRVVGDEVRATDQAAPPGPNAEVAAQDGRSAPTVVGRARQAVARVILGKKPDLKTPEPPTKLGELPKTLIDGAQNIPTESSAQIVKAAYDVYIKGAIGDVPLSPEGKAIYLEIIKKLYSKAVRSELEKDATTTKMRKWLDDKIGATVDAREVEKTRLRRAGGKIISPDELEKIIDLVGGAQPVDSISTLLNVTLNPAERAALTLRRVDSLPPSALDGLVSEVRSSEAAAIQALDIALSPAARAMRVQVIQKVGVVESLDSAMLDGMKESKEILAIVRQQGEAKYANDPNPRLRDKAPADGEAAVNAFKAATTLDDAVKLLPNYMARELQSLLGARNEFSAAYSFAEANRMVLARVSEGEIGRAERGRPIGPGAMRALSSGGKKTLNLAGTVLGYLFDPAGLGHGVSLVREAPVGGKVRTGLGRAARGVPWGIAQFGIGYYGYGAWMRYVKDAPEREKIILEMAQQYYGKVSFDNAGFLMTKDGKRVRADISLGQPKSDDLRVTSRQGLKTALADETPTVINPSKLDEMISQSKVMAEKVSELNDYLAAALGPAPGKVASVVKKTPDEAKQALTDSLAKMGITIAFEKLRAEMGTKKELDIDLLIKLRKGKYGDWQNGTMFTRAQAVAYQFCIDSGMLANEAMEKYPFLLQNKDLFEFLWQSTTTRVMPASYVSNVIAALEATAQLGNARADPAKFDSNMTAWAKTKNFILEAPIRPLSFLSIFDRQATEDIAGATKTGFFGLVTANRANAAAMQKLNDFVIDSSERIYGNPSDLAKIIFDTDLSKINPLLNIARISQLVRDGNTTELELILTGTGITLEQLEATKTREGRDIRLSDLKDPITKILQPLGISFEDMQAYIIRHNRTDINLVDIAKLRGFVGPAMLAEIDPRMRDSPELVAFVGNNSDGTDRGVLRFVKDGQKQMIKQDKTSSLYEILQDLATNTTDKKPEEIYAMKSAVKDEKVVGGGKLVPTGYAADKEDVYQTEGLWRGPTASKIRGTAPGKELTDAELETRSQSIFQRRYLPDYAGQQFKADKPKEAELSPLEIEANKFYSSERGSELAGLIEGIIARMYIDQKGDGQLIRDAFTPQRRAELDTAADIEADKKITNTEQKLETQAKRRAMRAVMSALYDTIKSTEAADKNKVASWGMVISGSDEEIKVTISDTRRSETPIKQFIIGVLKVDK